MRRSPCRGIGNVGSNYAVILEEMVGAKLVAASDSKGGIYNRQGMDAKKVLAHKEKTGSVVGFPGSEEVSNEEVLETECDVLCPGGFRERDNGDVAKGVRAKMVVEAANGPTTPGGRQGARRGNKVFLVPDILANSGGVMVSYLEWVQDHAEATVDRGGGEHDARDQDDGGLRAREHEEAARAGCPRGPGRSSLGWAGSRMP